MFKYEDCKRYRVKIDGQNYYLTKGENFQMATVPFENRPEMLKERLSVDRICDAFTEAMGGSNE